MYWVKTTAWTCINFTYATSSSGQLLQMVYSGKECKSKMLTPLRLTQMNYGSTDSGLSISRCQQPLFTTDITVKQTSCGRF